MSGKLDQKEAADSVVESDSDSESESEFEDGVCEGCDTPLTKEEIRYGDENPSHQSAWASCPECGRGPWCSGYCMAENCCFGSSSEEDE